MLIGGANDFQEYVQGYYDIRCDLTSDDMTTIAGENRETQQVFNSSKAAIMSTLQLYFFHAIQQ